MQFWCPTFTEGVIMLQHQNRPYFLLSVALNLVAGRGRSLEKFLTIGSMEDLTLKLSFLVKASLFACYWPGSNEVFTPLMLEALKKDEVLLPRELVTDSNGSPQVGEYNDYDTASNAGTLWLDDVVHDRAQIGVLDKMPTTIASILSARFCVRFASSQLIESNEDFLVISKKKW